LIMTEPSPTGIERDPVVSSGDGTVAEGATVWRMDARHVRCTAVRFCDGTDSVNELVHEQEWLLHPRETVRFNGNLFCLDNLETGEWWIFVLPAPLPSVRLTDGEGGQDVQINLCDGMLRVECADPGWGAEWVRLKGSGGALDRTRTLHAWQQAHRPSHPHHQLPLFLSNTWGDRSRDSRMNEAFMLREIQAAARLGIDVVQLDDGWQKGITSNSSLAAERGGVWDGFWNQDSDFWTVHPERFPRGLAPLREAAREAGLHLGLWFAPDSWNEFANWERDAERLYELHREEDVCFFKLDGIKLRSELGGQRLRAMCARVQERSGGAVVFDLDITAETRPGYWGLLEAGPLFVENRYTDWHVYWPHFVFRTLWKLSRWVDPRRLRLEVLNPLRNQDVYAGDPLAPSAYSADSLFASVLAANPLGWFEASGLAEETVDGLRPLVEIWKQEREAFFSGTLFPVGPCPDGQGISGLLSVAPDGRGAYALFMRGMGKESCAGIDLPLQVDGAEARSLHGTGRVSLSDSRIEVDIPSPCSHLWVKIPGPRLRS